MASIFTDEWRECLRAHYTYVVRTGDQGTERTLRGVMLEAGFGDDEVRQLYVLATAHVDDVGADFVPNMEIFEEETPVMVAVAMPQGIVAAMVVEDALDADEAADLEIEAALDNGEGADLEAEALEDTEDVQDEAEPPKDDPGVTQLSLF